MRKGVLEGVVLEIIGRGEIYGYEIVRKLHAVGFSDIAEGTVYALLLRLEKGRLVCIIKRPSAIGPMRKFYTLSESGQTELAAFWDKWRLLRQCIETLSGGEG